MSARALPATILARTASADLPSNVAPQLLVSRHPEIQNVGELENRLTIALQEDSGTQLDVQRTVETASGGYRVTLVPPASFHPGVYALNALLESARGASRALQRFYRTTAGGGSDDLTLLSAAVHWGDIAINTDTGTYHPGDTATVHIAVLDDDDTTKCSPPLTVTVTDPAGHDWTYASDPSSAGTAETSAGPTARTISGPACPLTATGSAASTVMVPLAQPGEYAVAVRYPSLGTGDTVARGVLRVTEDRPLLRVRRTSATQTTPGRSEIMTIAVTAERTFRGTISDTVPAGFAVTDVGNFGESRLTGDATTVSWDRQLTAGETVTLMYRYRVDDDAPLFGLFGPLTANGTVDRVDEPASVAASSAASSLDGGTASASSSASAGEGDTRGEGASGSGASSVSSADDASHPEGMLLDPGGDPLAETGSTAGGESPASGSASMSASSDAPAPDEQAATSSESSSSSPLTWLWNWLAPSAVGQDLGEQVSFSDEHRWQVLATLPTAGRPATPRRVKRTLLLERTQAAFTAQEAPTFTLVDVHFDTGAVLDESGHLKADVAVRELLSSVISQRDIEQALLKRVVQEKAESIADIVAENNGVSAEQVAKALADGGNQEAVAQALSEQKTVQAAVDGIDTGATADRIVQTILAGTEDPASVLTDSGAVRRAVDQTMAGEKPRVKQQLGDAVAQAIAASPETAQAVADAAETPGSSPATQTAGEAPPLLHLVLRGPHGEVFENPPFHFEVGSVVLAVDPIRSFRPGLYTLELTVTNPLSGERQTLTQQFAWGVLAMNPDKDHYRPGDIARLAFGVLDDEGRVVCDASVSLEVESPDGTRRTLSTDDGSIAVTGTCGNLEAGFIGPDYEAELPLRQVGAHRLTLTATTKNGTRSIATTVHARTDAPITITRSAATRLWPVAPSPMDITVAFRTEVYGSVIDQVPPGFIVSRLDPPGGTERQPDGTTLIRWEGHWQAGETAHFRYLYDAPDISPEFFLIGPLQIRGATPVDP